MQTWTSMNHDASQLSADVNQDTSLFTVLEEMLPRTPTKANMARYTSWGGSEVWKFAVDSLINREKSPDVTSNVGVFSQCSVSYLHMQHLTQCPPWKGRQSPVPCPPDGRSSQWSSAPWLGTLDHWATSCYQQIKMTQQWYSSSSLIV